MQFNFNGHKRIFIFLAIFILSLTLFIAWGLLSHRRDALYLALNGPMSGESQSNGKSMVEGAQLCLNQINQQGGIHGRKIKLLIFDDQNNPDIAVEKARAIVEETQALAVLGHYSSSTSIKGGQVYQELGIPAISGSATADVITKDNDWYFRTIFTNRSQATFWANYVKRILNYDRASIIYNTDSYGTSLAEAFANTFSELGGKINIQEGFNDSAENPDEETQRVLTNLLQKAKYKPGIIFLATHGNEAEKFIVQMKRQGLKYPIIGADAIGDIVFGKRFNKYPEEQTIPGYFSDGIYATSPLIFDVASEKYQQFRHEYIEKYNKEPGWAAATYYDAALVAVEAIKLAEVEGEDISKERQKIRDYLGRISTREDAVKGVTGSLYFDPSGNVVKPVYVGLFEKQHFISALTQLQPVNDLRRIADLEQELKAERILLVNNKYMYKTNVVYTGIDINSVSNLDLKSKTYTADFYLWFRYKGEVDADNIEFTNYAVGRLDSGEKLELKEPIISENIEGVNYKVYRLKADFHSHFSFQDYPFDRQKLAIKFTHANLTRKNIIYVVDTVGIQGNSNQEILSSLKKAQAFNSIGDWEVKAVRFFQDILKNDSTLGNPYLLDSDFHIEYSRFNTAIDIKRNTVSFSLKNLLPLLLMVGVSYLLLFLPFEDISVEAISGVLLTVVFFHLALLEGLPEGIGYVVALDYAFYIIYVLIILEMLLVVVGKVQIYKLQSNSAQTSTLWSKNSFSYYPSLFWSIIYPQIWTFELTFNRVKPSYDEF